MATAPLFTRIVPAAVRETTMALSAPSPATVNVPAATAAVTDIITRSSSASTVGPNRRPSIFVRTGRRSGRILFVHQRVNQVVVMGVTPENFEPRQWIAIVGATRVAHVCD